MRVAEAMALARDLRIDRLDAQLLLGHTLARPRSWLIAHDDAALSAGDEAAFRQAAMRRAAGEPLAYIVGRREFRGLELEIVPGVLVPRPETEGLVDWALECLAGWPRPSVLDLGCGSGAIAVALACARADAEVTAVDLAEPALRMTRANALRHGARVTVQEGDWWQAVPGRTYELVVSNPPYIAEHDPHLPALASEPAAALVSGADGLEALRTIVGQALAHLVPGGWLLLEHGCSQGAAVRRLLAEAGFVDVSTRQDLAGLDRCSGGQRPPRGTTTPAGKGFAV